MHGGLGRGGAEEGEEGSALGCLWQRGWRGGGELGGEGLREPRGVGGIFPDAERALYIEM